MKKMLKIGTFNVFVCFLLSLSPSVFAQTEGYLWRVLSVYTGRIVSIDSDGILVWSNSLPGLVDRIQRASVNDPTNWADYIRVPITSAVSSMQVFDLDPPTKMSLIPAGEFVMGDVMNDGYGYEGLVHTNYISAFYIDQYEVTKALWEEVKAFNGGNGYSYSNPGQGKATNHPVYGINWYDAVKWCNSRSEMDGLTPAYYLDDLYSILYKTGQVDNVHVNWSVNGYRLPTEAEWEKAARGGLENIRFPWGNTISHENVNYANRQCYWWPEPPYVDCYLVEYHPLFNDGIAPYTSPVGYFAANTYGLYDMAGNVYEICWDVYSDVYHLYSPYLNPRGPSIPGDDFYRMARGGSWDMDAPSARIAGRYGSWPGWPGRGSGGFRCARGLDGGVPVRSYQSIVFDSIQDQLMNSTVEVSAIADSGLSVAFDVISGPAALTESVLSFSGTGRVQVVASQAGNINWFAAEPLTNSFLVTVNPATNYLVIDLSKGSTATNYPVSYLDAVPAGGWTHEYKTTKLVLRRISAGTFTMGSPTSELGRENTETQHDVTLTGDFYIGVFEVTQRQWERVMGDWPSYFRNTDFRDTRPLDGVSYFRIRENPAGTDDPLVDWPSNSNVNEESFIGKLRAKSQLLTADLPTEAQWEYACRANTSAALNSGFDLLGVNSDARMNSVGRYWYNSGQTYSIFADTSNGTAEVGSYDPNAWGIYDMHGNAVEWCLDWYDLYSGNTINPKGASSGSFRVIRGGSFLLPAYLCRSAQRIYAEPIYSSFQDGAAGFRVAINVP